MMEVKHCPASADFLRDQCGGRTCNVIPILRKLKGRTDGQG